MNVQRPQRRAGRRDSNGQIRLNALLLCYYTNHVKALLPRLSSCKHLFLAFVFTSSFVTMQAQSNWVNSTGDERWETALNWNPAAVPNGNSFDVKIGIRSPCNLNSGFPLRSLALETADAQLNLLHGSSLAFSSSQPIINNGTVVVNSDGMSGATTMQILGNGTIDGAGQIVLNGAASQDARVLGATNGTLTQASTHTIRGRGDVNTANGVLVNNGVITADVAGSSLRLTLSNNTANKHNGLFQATAGGGLALLQGTTDASGGGKIVADGVGSYVQLGNGYPGFILQRATFYAHGGAVIGPVSYTTWDSCTNLGLVQIDSGGAAIVTGTGLVNNGQILLSDAGTGAGGTLLFQTPSLPTGLNLDGDGEIRLDCATYRNASFRQGAPVTQGRSHRINGRGFIWGDSFINNGTISSDRPGGTILIQSYLYNNQMIEAINGATLQIDSHMTGNNSGVIRANGLGSLVLMAMSNPGQIQSQNLRSENGGLIKGQYPRFDGCTIDGTLELYSSDVTGAGVTNNGHIMVTSSLWVQSAGEIRGSGVIELRGTLIIGTSNTTVVTNSNSHTISGNGTIQPSSGSTFVNNGTIAPGLPGKISLRQWDYGTLTLGTNSRLAFQIGGTTAVSQYSVLQKEQFDQTPLVLRGSLVVALANGFTPAVNDTFNVIITQAPIGGSFKNVASGQRLNTIDGSGSFEVDYSGNNVVLSNFGPRVAVAPVSLTNAVSRKIHGAAGAFDVNLFGSAAKVECRSGGTTGDHQLVFTFDHDVVSGNATVTAGTGNVARTPVVSENQLFVNLTGTANAQTLTLTLSNVVDTLGAALPNTTLTIGLLLGDTNGDAFVNAGDALQTRNRSGQAADATNFRSDVNDDGFVDSGDTIVVRARSGTSLP